MTRKRLRPEILVDSQINLKIHAVTRKKLLELAKAKGYGNGRGQGHCRLAREILENFVEGRTVVA